LDILSENIYPGENEVINFKILLFHPSGPIPSALIRFVILILES